MDKEKYKNLLTKLNEEVDISLLDNLQKNPGPAIRLINTVIAYKKEEIYFKTFKEGDLVEKGMIKNEDFLKVYQEANKNIKDNKRSQFINYGFKTHKLLEDYLRQMHLL